jgi:hypothetical protein
MITCNCPRFLIPFKTRSVLSPYYISIVFVYLAQGGGKDLIYSLLSSSSSFMKFFAYVAFCLEVFLALLPSHEDLSIVSHD